MPEDEQPLIPKLSPFNAKILPLQYPNTMSGGPSNVQAALAPELAAHHFHLHKLADDELKVVKGYEGAHAVDIVPQQRWA